MNPPKQSYRIWHANRSGSTYLCELLSALGYAGNPGEHLTVHTEKSLAEKFGVDNYEDLKKAVWKIGSSSNEVYADKSSGHHQYHKTIVEEICGLKGIAVPSSYEVVWSDFFPNCKHILIIRTNKVRQAVSWWKAIQDDQWHLRGEEKNENDLNFYADKYNVDALHHLYKEAVLRDIANQEYLTKHNLDFITVTYEDLDANPLRILNSVLEWIDLPLVESLPKIRIKKTSTEINNIWVEKFKKDLQESFEVKILV